MGKRAQRRDVTSEDWQAGGAAGDVIAALKKEGHINDQQYVVAYRLFNDMQQAHGTSAGLITSYGEYVPGSGLGRALPPGIGDLDAFRRMRAVVDGLRQHERELLSFLITCKDQARGSLADWGRQRSAYQTAKTARALATGQVHSLLSSVVELYPIPRSPPAA